MKKRIFIVVSVILLIAAILFVYFAFLQKPSPMQAHKAKNTTPLETDKFFDMPDFMIYEIGGERIECTPEETAAIYAEFERMVANLRAIGHFCLCLPDLENIVPDMKETGAIRFCYDQRRKYTGTYPHTVPVQDDDGKDMLLTDYDWNDFTFDEVMLNGYEIVLAEGGAYKSPSNADNNTMHHIQMHFHKSVYSSATFDEAVLEILRVRERFPHLFESGKRSQPQYNLT